MRDRLRRQKLELEAALAHIHRLATHDDLTGLVNRRHMQELLENERMRLERSEQDWCVALIDLDHFKSVNDAHGHAIGDEVLRALSRHAHTLIRRTDVLARWGGEEFVLLLPNTAMGMASTSLERLREHFHATRWSSRHRIALSSRPASPNTSVARASRDAGTGGQALLPGQDAGAQPGGARLSRSPARDNRAMHLVIPYASAVSDAAVQALGTLGLPNLEHVLARWAPVEDPGTADSPPSDDSTRIMVLAIAGRQVFVGMVLPDVAASDGGRCPPYRIARITSPRLIGWGRPSGSRYSVSGARPRQWKIVAERSSGRTFPSRG